MGTASRHRGALRSDAVSAGVDVEAHRAAVRSGLAWLYDTEQPERAILQHHGESLASQGNRSVRFIPSGWAGRVVIVVDVTKVEYGTDRRARGPLNPLAAGELLLRQCLQQEQRNVEMLHAQLQATVQQLISLLCSK